MTNLKTVPSTSIHVERMEPVIDKVVRTYSDTRSVVKSAIDELTIQMNPPLPKSSPIIKSLQTQIKLIDDLIGMTVDDKTLIIQRDADVKQEQNVTRKAVVKEYGRPIERIFNVNLDVPSTAIVNDVEFVISSTGRFATVKTPQKYLCGEKEPLFILGCVDGLMPMLIEMDHIFRNSSFSVKLTISSRNVLYSEASAKKQLESFVDDIKKGILRRLAGASITTDFGNRLISFYDAKGFIETLNLLYSAFPCSADVEWRPVTLCSDDLESG